MQCMRCFSSLGWFALVDIVRWAAMEVAHMARKLTVLYMGIFPTYHVKTFPESFPIICFFHYLIPFIFVPTSSGICIAKS